ncbi:hypothetical protein L6452_01171 [Arctium lappa]|uniref:Uncharacterized protein n=1 Tax=Arctium lappa TaxID=4217 RepID=A0ACB9FGT3_ARCLA|nr:hypothetical protein L6452_01171 [Arctium lappa]
MCLLIWTMLLEHIDDLTLKSLSTTRWERHIESVKAIKTQVGEIKDALIQLAQVSEDGKMYRDVDSLVNGELSSFDFILRVRFEQMQEFESIFGFLFDGRKLVTLHDDELKKSCMNIELALTNDDDYDIDGEYLYMELHILQGMLPEEASKSENPWTSIQILEFAKEMDMFPHDLVAYRILLTVPVTVASTERSFSKLKVVEVISTVYHEPRKIERVSNFEY